MRTLAILPVKSFPHAKQRLRREVPPSLRESLAEAMFCDVLSALGDTAAVDSVLVISPSERVRELAKETCGALTLLDAEVGHNAAAEMGVQVALELGAQRALLVPGDCPTLDPGELETLLGHTHASPGVIIVPDRHGTGTNALLLTPPDAMAPSFGPGSCARHAEHAERAGIAHEVVEVPSLALDVDTPEDLESVAALGARAPRTHELLARC